MGYSVLKRNAKRITTARSLKPDLQYILYSFFLSLTVIGLPIALSIFREYRRYLLVCIEEHNSSSSTDGIRPKKIYEYKAPTSVLFDYNLKAFAGALKAILCVMFPGAMFFNMKHLSEERNFQVKMGLADMKLYFVYVFIAEPTILFLAGLIAFSGSLLCIAICALLIVCIAVLLFRPFVVYCQAYVMYEKECREMSEENCDYEEE